MKRDATPKSTWLLSSPINPSSREPACKLASYPHTDVPQDCDPTRKRTQYLRPPARFTWTNSDTICMSVMPTQNNPYSYILTSYNRTLRFLQSKTMCRSQKVTATKRQLLYPEIMSSNILSKKSNFCCGNYVIICKTTMTLRNPVFSFRFDGGNQRTGKFARRWLMNTPSNSV